jgi:hypothetical protein
MTTRIAHGKRGSGIHTYVLDPEHFTQVGADGIGEVLQTLTSTIRWEGPSRTGLVELEIAPTLDLPADVIAVCVHGTGWVAIRVHADHATDAGCQALRRAVLARLPAGERRSSSESAPKVKPRRALVLGLAASLLLAGTWGANGAYDVLPNLTESLSPTITSNGNVAPTADLVVPTADLVVSTAGLVSPAANPSKAVPAPVVKVAGIPTSKVVGAGSVPDAATAAGAVKNSTVVVAPPVVAAPVVPLTAAEQTARDASNAAALTARNAKAAADLTAANALAAANLTAANALAAANLTAANAAAAAEAVRVKAAADAWAVAHPNG